MSLVKFERGLERVLHYLGNLLAIILVLMIANVLYDVVMRYFFHASSVAMQELEWHLFAVVILFGISYTLKEDGHVRVDFLYERFSAKTRAVINIVGTVLFLIPFSLLIIYGSYTFVMDAYTFNEVSQDPGGLTHRWIIKAMIPLSFGVLLLASVHFIVKNINRFKGVAQ